MVLETGSLILANYTAKVKDTGELVETTIEEEAKNLNVYDPTRRYEPRLISVGEGWVLKGVDEALQSANIGDKFTVEVPPEKGFGARDPSKVRLLPLRKFGDKASELGVGDQVEVDNRIGLIRLIGSGRVQVDFNHRFAGKTLEYQVELVKKLETDQEKIVGLIRRRLPVDEERVKLKVEDDSVTIELPEDLYLMEGLQIIKRGISGDVFKYLPSAKRVQFLELYEAPKPKEVPEAKPEAKPEEKVEEKEVEAKVEEEREEKPVEEVAEKAEEKPKRARRRTE